MATMNSAVDGIDEMKLAPYIDVKTIYFGIHLTVGVASIGRSSRSISKSRTLVLRKVHQNSVSAWHFTNVIYDSGITPNWHECADSYSECSVSGIRRCGCLQPAEQTWDSQRAQSWEFWRHRARTFTHGIRQSHENGLYNGLFPLNS
jgi:hypothetical protein